MDTFLPRPYFSELLGTRVRHSGPSVSYQFASILGGGFAPLLYVALVACPGSSTWVAVYVTGASLISLISSYLLSETYKSSLSEEQEAPGEAVAGRMAE